MNSCTAIIPHPEFASFEPKPSDLLRCPACGWKGARSSLHTDSVGLFAGIGSCPDCDTLEGHLEPLTGPQLLTDDEPDYLERYGPRPEYDRRVHYRKGFHLGVADFLTYTNSSDYKEPPQRAPRQEDEYHIDCRNMARVVRLLDTFTAASPAIMRQIAEMRYRILVTHPHCLDF